jgi:MFS family permease
VTTAPASSLAAPPATQLRLGLAANASQFVLLVLVNAFVGAMVGLERSVLPLMAEQSFGLASAAAATAFIAVFGLTKALSNLGAATLIGRIGRRRTLILGWLMAIPAPLLVLAAPTWSWIVMANVFLGINQGLAWSTTVIMKIDLVGPRRRGLAMGLNEFAGYLAVAVAAFVSGALAVQWGPRATVGWLTAGVALVGLVLSVAFVRDTTGHAQLEQASLPQESAPVSLRTLLRRSTWSDARLFSISQAGFVNNLNDGVAWGLFPLLFAQAALSTGHIGLLAAIYPATWGIAQVWTGALSDRVGRKPLIVIGMIAQGLALAAIPFVQGLVGWSAALVVLGLGTALVYPTLLAGVGDFVAPRERAAAVGVYRLWRDLGYAAGAIVAGMIADAFGLTWAIEAVALLTVASGLVVAIRLRERPIAPAGIP